MSRWLRENECDVKMIVPDTDKEIRKLYDKDKRHAWYIANEFTQVKRLMAHLNYGKYFLEPNQQEKAFLQSFLDRGLPENIDLTNFDLEKAENRLLLIKKLKEFTIPQGENVKIGK